MPFDGVAWASGHKIDASAYQPQAGNRSDPWFFAITGAYARSRLAGRLVATTQWPYTGLTGDDAMAASGVFSLTPQTIAALDGYVEGTWSHAVAIVCYQVFDAALAFNVFSVTDNIPVTVTAQNAAGLTPSAAARDPVGNTVYGYDSRNDPGVSQLAALEVSLSGLTLDADMLFTFAANAETSAPAEARLYRPHWLSVFLECRG